MVCFNNSQANKIFCMNLSLMQSFSFLGSLEVVN